MTRKTFFILTILFLAITGGVVFSFPDLAFTGSVEEIQRQIEERNAQIESLEREIARFRSQADSTAREAQTLENRLAELTSSRRALEAELQLAQNHLNNTRVRLDQVMDEIRDIEGKIERYKDVLSRNIRDLDSLSRSSFLVTFFSQETLSDVWQEATILQQVQDVLTMQVRDLAELNQDLHEQRLTEEEERQNLMRLNNELEGRQEAIQYTIAEQDRLVRDTRQEEAQYRRIVEDKQRQRERFEQELFAFEAQLKQRIDPTSIPSARPGTLSWPLNSIFVTQQFGRTAASGRLYASGTHPGVDFRASIGTPVHSAQSGVVRGVGNTDQVPGCLSYGKWVLVEHNNGLSTMYAHLSVVSVSEGQAVGNRQVIGYSGNTGFSTGPHLHLEVYASHGVSVQPYSTSINCKAARIPLTDRQGARLDPMQYLPPL